LLLTFWLDLTGVGWHQWLGVALGVLITYHFLAHWKWVEAISRRVFGRLTRQPRIYFVIDLAVLSGFYLIGLTGLVISTWLGLELGDYAAWRNLHVWASIAPGVGGVKIGLHQGWIVSQPGGILGGRRRPARVFIVSQAAGSLEPKVAVPGGGRLLREDQPEDFLILMGTVGAAVVSTIRCCTIGGRLQRRAEEDETRSLIAEESRAPLKSAYSSSSACLCNAPAARTGHCKRTRIQRERAVRSGRMRMSKGVGLFDAR
jgi:hypothetical protein